MRVGFLARSLRVFAWNGVLCAAGTALVAFAAEGYLRATAPFMNTSWQRRYAPRVGSLLSPTTEVRHTNGLDFWTVSRVNSYGFIDREPPTPEDASLTCHVAVIGDSFVEARMVPIVDKLHVRLEETAASVLPHLGITASAFAYRGSGQAQQLAYYDEYARHLRPKVIVLVFVPNDFRNNYPLFRAMEARGYPDRLSSTSVARTADGTMAFRRPSSTRAAVLRNRPPPSPSQTSFPWLRSAWAETARTSWLVQWLRAKQTAMLGLSDEDVLAYGEILSKDRRYAGMFMGWRPAGQDEIDETFGSDRSLPPIFEDALEHTAFALEQFKARADRDGAHIVLLASHRVRQRGSRFFERLSAVADAAGIPVVDQAEYILRQGAQLDDAQWAHDTHWNVAGHRWAAEALLEYLGQRANVCEGARLDR